MGNINQDSNDKRKSNSKNCNIINQNKFMIYHQNITGINNKIDELLLSFTELPHVICLSEHHLKEFEITIISLDQYTLASKYYRKNFQQGGVCIYVQKSIQFTNIYKIVTCKEKDLELCGSAKFCG
jgi:hypothetical protein